jgi:NADH:ubiquinone reductase (H+-translocating)
MPDRHVIVVGAGFAGLNAALSLAGAGVTVTLIDRQNHHLFQPLLYQVATAGLSPADIAAPIRSIVKRTTSVRVLMDELTGIDTAMRTVSLLSGATLNYDELVIATGATHSYFGNDDWAAHAPGIKTIDDAIRVRRDLLLAMERAETMRQENITSRDEPVTFVVIGGGPTGVEMAGAIAELARHAAEMDFRNITKNCVHVVLIEGGPRLLPGFPEKLGVAAQRGLESLGVQVRLGTRVTGIDAEGVNMDDIRLKSAATIWAAGVQASPAARWLGLEGDRAGRVPVLPDLTVPGHPEIFVVGDTAAVAHNDGFVPGIAAAAKQQGRYVAHVIARRTQGRSAPSPFRYRDHGKLATIGRKRAVADFGWAQVSGFPAWALWSTVHIYFLVGFRNRLVVGANWLWNYVTFDRGARLITGRTQSGQM